MSIPTGQQQGIQSVEVAMRVLEALERLGGPGALSAIASEAGLGPSTTHRYLVSLTRAGLVAQESSSGLYDFGPAARRLGMEAIRRTDEMAVATPFARALRDRTGHTVNLSVWAENGPTIVHWEHGHYPLPILARVGTVLPLTGSSVGRVFLAYLPRRTTDVLREIEQRNTNSAPLTEDQLRALTTEVLASGIAVTDNAVVPGVAALVAPVFGPDDTLVLAIGCVVPIRLATQETRAEVETELRRTAGLLSADLGARPRAGKESSARPGGPAPRQPLSPARE